MERREGNEVLESSKFANVVLFSSFLIETAFT
jgi:hypothetical protein